MRAMSTWLRGTFALSCAFAALAVACTAPRADEPTSETTSAASRAPFALRYRLELDGVGLGYVQKIGGGDTGNPVIDASAPPAFHIDEFEADLGLSTGKQLLSWIEASLEKKHERKSGTVIAAHFKGDVVQILDVRDARLTEIAFPATEASAKEPARIAMKVAVVSVVDHAAPGVRVDAGADGPKAGLSSSRARLIVGGVELHPSAMGALTIAPGTGANAPNRVSDLVVTLPIGEAKALAQTSAPREALVEYFGEDQKTVAAGVGLSGVVVDGVVVGNASAVVTMHVGDAHLPGATIR